MQHQCREVRDEQLTEPRLWLLVRSFFVFHVMRRFPAWAGWLPAHVPRLAPARTRLPDSAEARSMPRPPERTPNRVPLEHARDPAELNGRRPGPPRGDVRLRVATLVAVGSSAH